MEQTTHQPNNIQLDHELLDNLAKTLAQHDEKSKHPGIACQYLAATIGYLVGSEKMQRENKQQILNDLCQFIFQVAGEVDQNNQEGSTNTAATQATPANTAAAPTIPTPQSRVAPQAPSAQNTPKKPNPSVARGGPRMPNRT